MEVAADVSEEEEEAAVTVAAVGHGSIWNACLKKTGLSRYRLSPIYNSHRRRRLLLPISSFELVITGGYCDTLDDRHIIKITTKMYLTRHDYVDFPLVETTRTTGQYHRLPTIMNQNTIHENLLSKI